MTTGKESVIDVIKANPQKIAPADLEPVKVASLQETGKGNGRTEPLDIWEIADGILDGQIDPAEGPDLLVIYTNHVVDLPYIPERLEGQILRMVASALEDVLIDQINRRANG